MLREDHPLSWYFHRNSRSLPGTADQDAESDLFAAKEYAGRPSIGLQAPVQDQSGYAALLAMRRSVRTFAPSPVTLAQLSTILAQCYGLGSCETVGDFDRCRRPVPSAGATYPLEIYLIALDLAGLAPGLYHYRVIDHALECLAETRLSRRRMGELFLDQKFLTDAGAILVMTAVFARCMTKYGDRGYRYTLIEAGHVGQNIMLSAQAGGLGALPVGGFDDRRLGLLLDLDAEEEAPIYAVAIGRSDEQNGP
jgi:SagB-type dehydrogenase family enzyme